LHIAYYATSLIVMTDGVKI